ncbi:MAG: hypothetical protein ABI785_05365 [Gemmatimonadales bacterium]
MDTLGVSWRLDHLRRTHSREIDTMSPEPQDAFAERMKGEVYSSYRVLSTSPSCDTPGPG